MLHRRGRRPVGPGRVVATRAMCSSVRTDVHISAKIPLPQFPFPLQRQGLVTLFSSRVSALNSSTRPISGSTECTNAAISGSVSPRRA